MRTPYQQLVQTHYAKFWRGSQTVFRWHRGPCAEAPEGFRVVRFAPTAERTLWTYATCGMSAPGDRPGLEVCIVATRPNELLVELLSAIAWYHRSEERLGEGHTVELGRPWFPGSRCDHGLISLPYLDGPDFERFHIGRSLVRCLWLIPITEEERRFKVEYGLESLEQRFEASAFDYADPERPSVV